MLVFTWSNKIASYIYIYYLHVYIRRWNEEMDLNMWHSLLFKKTIIQVILFKNKEKKKEKIVNEVTPVCNQVCSIKNRGMLGVLTLLLTHGSNMMWSFFIKDDQNN